MHSKRSKITGLLSKGFKADKCKTSIKMGMSRMKLMKNKRDVQLKQMRREVAQLLESGQEQTARIRVEHVIREEKTIAAYEFLEVYCELIVSRLHIIDGQKTCPIDLKEAIASVIFAAPRCADIPELSEVKTQFQSKYGKDFVVSALEVRPDSGVARMVVDKLSANAPHIDVKVKVLKAIAEENNIQWDPKGFEDEMKKPQTEKLGGNSNFYSASGMSTSPPSSPPSTYNPQPPPPPPGYYDNTNSNFQSPDFPPAPTTPVHVRAPSTSRPPETDYGNMPNSDPEYNTVEEAAEAAAKSAQLASRAAKAAADMARQGSLSREPSIASHKSSSPKNQDDFDDVISSSRPVRTSTPKKEKRIDVAPPSPSHSSASSGGDYDDHEFVEPKRNDRKKFENSASSQSKRKSIVKKSNSKGRAANWDEHDHKEEVDELSDSSEMVFDDSKFDAFKKGMFKREDSYGSHSNVNPNSSDVFFDDSERVERKKNESFSRHTREDSHGSRSNAIFDSSEEVFDDSYRVERKKNESFSRHTREDSHGSRSNAIFDSSEEVFDNSNRFERKKNESFSRQKREESYGSHSNVNFDSPEPVFDNSNMLERKKNKSIARHKREESASSSISIPSHKYSYDSIPPSPKPSRTSPAFKNEISLLSILSTGGQLPPDPPVSSPKFDSDVESSHDLKFDSVSSPKFDSGPTFDGIEHSGHDEYERENTLHMKAVKEDVKIVEKEKENKREKEVVSSSDERNTEYKPKSMRTRNPIKKGPLKYIPKENSSHSDDDDDESANQPSLNYNNNNIMGGLKNKPYSRPPYTSQPLVEEPKPVKKPIKGLSDLDVESFEERRVNKNKPNKSYGKAKEEDPPSPIPELGDSDDEDDGYGYEPSSYQKFKNLKIKKDMYTPPVIKISPFKDGTSDERKPATRYTPTRANLSEEEEEEDIFKPVKKPSKESGSSRPKRENIRLVNEDEYDDQIPPLVSRRREDARPIRATRNEPIHDNEDEYGLYSKPVEKPRKEVVNKPSTRRNPREPLRFEEEEEILSDEPTPPLVTRRGDARSTRKPIQEQRRETRDDYDDELYNKPRKEVVSKPTTRRNPNLEDEFVEEEEEEEKIPIRRSTKSTIQSKPAQRNTQPRRTTPPPTRNDIEEEDEEEEVIPIKPSSPPVRRVRQEIPKPIVNEGKQKLEKEKEKEKEKKKEEEVKASVESERKESSSEDDVAAAAPPRPGAMTFPLDMEALRARVKEIQANMR